MSYLRKRIIHKSFCRKQLQVKDSFTEGLGGSAALHFRESVRGKDTPAKSEPLAIYEVTFENYFANRVANLAKWQTTPASRWVRVSRPRRFS